MIPPTCGQACHIVVEHAMKGEPDAESLRQFDLFYKDWSEENVPVESELYGWPNVRAIMERWLGLYRSHPYEVPNPDLIEVGFRLPVSPSLQLVGRIDGIVKHMGAWYVFDTKTTSKWDSRWVHGLSRSAQFVGYTAALRAHLDALGLTDPIAGVIINAIEIKKIPDSNRACPNHPGRRYMDCGIEHVKMQNFVMPSNPRAVEDWRRTITLVGERFAQATSDFPLLSDIARTPMEGTVNGHCSSCKFYDFCGMGGRLDLAQHMLEPDPWEPWPGAFEFDGLQKGTP